MTNDERRPNRADASPWLWLLQLIIAVVAYVQMFLSQLSIASCTATSCDYTLYSATVKTFNVGVVILLVVAAAGIFLLENLARPSFWSPVMGIVLTVALFAATYAMSRAALDLPLVGNRL
ncbi:hypothetical protein [Microbacterium sp. P05]|uniref:hypothetical protein n=1 Tax=Microbacterium sp. P05 TaxID=3366948 RepID=UPI00374539C0